VEGLSVTLRLERPAVKGFDRDLRLTAQGGGVYAAETVLPLKGQWEARLLAGRAGAPPVRLRSRVQVP
jgi:nitrogen fixation protein FixH